MRTAFLSVVLLVSGCATHVSYSSEIDADGDGDRDAGSGDAADAEGSVDGGSPCGQDICDEDCDGVVDDDCVDPPSECEPGETRPCESPQCDVPSECGEVQRCGEDGRWLGCGQCPPGIEIPTPEALGDGIDNDCDGVVDECDGDACECDAECLPGSMRWCEDPNYCSWGQQVCGEDGYWGSCTESAVPASCSSFAWLSPEAEACVLEAGECIQDYWDLDRDGDVWESLGGSCEPAPCP